MKSSQQIQYGGRPPYWKSSFGYISAIYCSINAKFCTKKQNHVQTQVTWPKYQILKVQDGGRPSFWKWFYRYLGRGSSYFDEIWCEDSNFGSKNGHMLIYKKIWNSKWRTAVILKQIVFWLYLHDLLSDSRDIWYVQVQPCSDTRHVTKVAIFENSTWRTAAILKMVS